MVACHKMVPAEYSLNECLENSLLTVNLLHRNDDSEPGFHILFHCIHGRNSEEVQIGNMELADTPDHVAVCNCNFPVKEVGP